VSARVGDLHPLGVLPRQGDAARERVEELGVQRDARGVPGGLHALAGEEVGRGAAQLLACRQGAACGLVLGGQLDERVALAFP
jgi:outer membrane lipoprotein SlyB